jgi:hypothetical protein
MPEPIVFNRPNRDPLKSGPPDHPILAVLWRFRFLVTQDMDRTGLVFRVLVWLAFATMGLQFLRAPLAPESVSGFWHMVNLPFHEAGHVIFGFLPRLGVSIMGSGGQLLMPLICCVVMFLTTRDLFGVTICLWWFGQNFLDIAPYIDDARRGTLPLLGGNTGQTAPYGFHDWQFILTELKLLQHDQAIAMASWRTGKVIIALALVWGAAILVYTGWQLFRPLDRDF